MALTDTRIRNAKAKDSPYKLTDGGGLHLEVRPTGAKLWRLRYRLAGRENVYALGQYPSISLAEARAQRDAAKTLIKQGIHPSHHRKLERLRQETDSRNSFKAVAMEWLQQNEVRWAATTLRQRRSVLEREVYPHIGSLPVRQVTPAHVLDILKRVRKDAPTMATVAKQAIGGVYRLAITTLRAQTDPTAPLRNYLAGHQQQHRAAPRAADVPGFFKALDDETLHVEIGFKLLFLTLLRTSEAVEARWEEIDWDKKLWTVPAERMKMRRPHRIPLPDQAVALLTRLHAVNGHRAHLFTNQRDARRPASDAFLRRALPRLIDPGRFTVHGIRAFGSSSLNEMGWRPDVIEAQLAHADRNAVRAAYNRTDYLDERREMMDAWAIYLDSLRSGSEVLPMRRGKAA